MTQEELRESQSSLKRVLNSHSLDESEDAVVMYFASQSSLKRVLNSH